MHSNTKGKMQQDSQDMDFLENRSILYREWLEEKDSRPDLFLQKHSKGIV